MDDDLLSQALQQRAQERQAARRQAQRAARYAASDVELDALAKSFVARMPAATAVPFVRQQRGPDVQRVERYGLLRQHKRTWIEWTWQVTELARGWALPIWNPIEVDYSQRLERGVFQPYALCVTTDARYMYGVVDDKSKHLVNHVVIEGVWTRSTREKQPHLELGRPTGVNLRGNIITTFGLGVQRMVGQRQLSPNSAWQSEYRTDIEASHDAVVRTIAQAMAAMVEQAS